MHLFRAALLATAVALVPAALADAAGNTAKHVRVSYDQSTLVQLDRPAKTVLVGNAHIADALLVNDKTVYVLGRQFGNTNLIVIDASGAEVLNTQVTVGAPEVAQVTLYRGPLGQRNLACAPQCERTVTSGDQEFDAIHQEASKKLTISTTAAGLSGGR